jgi:hypothetical protein
MGRPLFRSAAAAVFAFAVAACSNGSTEVSQTLTPTDANVAGTFSLYTANGRTLPYSAIVTNTEVWNLVSDVITILPNNTWADTTNYSITNRNDGSVSGRGTASGGTYSIANNQINFVMTSGGAINFAGSVTGNTLTAIFDGARYYYQR